MAAEIALPRRYRVANIALWCFAWMALVYLILPQFVIVPLSFSEQNYLSFPPSGWSLKWYERVAQEATWQRAAFNSFAIGIPTAFLSMIIGTLAALAVARGEMRRAGLASAFIIAPMMLPHVILAIGLYPLMLRLGLLGSYGAAIIGHTVVGVPLVFITVNASLARYPAALELAAMTMGARPWQTFWQVTFPLISVGVVIGGILAFAMSFDELMLALFLTTVGTQTLPRLIWIQMNDYLTPTIAAVASLIFLLTAILLAIVSLLQLRGSPGRGGNHG